MDFVTKLVEINDRARHFGRDGDGEVDRYADTKEMAATRLVVVEDNLPPKISD